jgi:phage tail sheath protein FI
MPITPTYPGVYIEEVPSGVRTIAGVATSIAAFVDFFKRGPMNTAVQIFSFSDFEREFGGLDLRSEASYAIQQFYLNGGSEAWVVRVASGTSPNDAAKATVILKNSAAATALTVSAKNEGIWGNNLRVGVDYAAPANQFNLTVSEVSNGNVVRQETFRNLSMAAGPNFVERIVNDGSSLVTVAASGTTRPVPTGTVSDAHNIPFTLAAGTRKVKITFAGTDADTKDNVDLGSAAMASLDEAAARLEGAIRSANPAKRGWANATVRVVPVPPVPPGGPTAQLQVVAGPSAPDAIITFAPAAADAATAGALKLTGATVTANVAQYSVGSTASPGSQGAGTEGRDGIPPDATALLGSQAVTPPTGMFALDKAPLFNILSFPRIAKVTGPDAFTEGQVNTVISTAITYCESRRAFLVLDTPSNVNTLPQVKTWMAARPRHKNAAVYFPRVQIADPLDDFRPRSLGASGTMAGLYARTDVARGVWKAPAGTEAVLRGVQKLDFVMTDLENGALNPLAINCLRTFPVYGNVAWGARTLDGSDQQASEWKYVPVRRLALFLEESLYRGTQWVVFEPNDEPLWSQIRLNVGAFMHNLFRQGAFQGQSPREAYLVKCDRETTTQNDINLGIVNIVVGFAPLKPAEFVILKIQQLAGQIQT